MPHIDGHIKHSHAVFGGIWLDASLEELHIGDSVHWLKSIALQESFSCVQDTPPLTDLSQSQFREPLLISQIESGVQQKLLKLLHIDLLRRKTRPLSGHARDGRPVLACRSDSIRARPDARARRLWHGRPVPERVVAAVAQHAGR